MKSKFLSGIIVAILSTGIVVPSWATDAWVSPVHITRVYPLADGSIVLTVDNDNPACTNTGVPKYYQITVGQNGVTADALKNMLAVALEAFATKSVVSINFSDTTSNCYVNRLFVQ